MSENMNGDKPIEANIAGETQEKRAEEEREARLYLAAKFDEQFASAFSGYYEDKDEDLSTGSARHIIENQGAESDELAKALDKIDKGRERVRQLAKGLTILFANSNDPAFLVEVRQQVLEYTSGSQKAAVLAGDFLASEKISEILKAWREKKKAEGKK